VDSRAFAQVHRFYALGVGRLLVTADKYLPGGFGANFGFYALGVGRLLVTRSD
jgi:hypothetical protein